MKIQMKLLFHEIRYLLMVSTILFLFALLFGFYLENKVEGSFMTNTDHSTRDILVNNLKASVPFLLGFISLGVSTVGALLINGVAIGGSIMASANELRPS